MIEENEIFAYHILASNARLQFFAIHTNFLQIHGVAREAFTFQNYAEYFKCAVKSMIAQSSRKILFLRAFFAVS